MSDQGYGTESEIAFLKGLGKWSMHSSNPSGTGKNRLQLLKSYLDTMHKRVNWGSIDPDRITQYICKELRIKTIVKPAPRYDEVYYEGMALLDKMTSGGIPDAY